MKLFLLMLFMAIALMATGQPPSGFSYQASLRNTDGTILSNRLVTIRITLTNQTSNTNFYSETHTSNTSALGIVSFNVGLGHDITGTFSEIPWGNEQVFIKIELQNNGGNYIEMGKTQLMSVPYAMFASDGNQGPQGEQGPPGEQGEQGEQGMPGNSGIDGRTILNGSDNPSTVDGADDDFYINTSTNTLFGPKTEGIWSSGVLLIGPQGNIGPAGADGEQGPSGIDGSAGINGRTILHGNSNPTVQGADGDFYINTTTNMLFGPKMTGIWPAGISLIGLEGIQGIAGENGISVQWLGTYASSPGNPTLNQAYYNSTDRKSYIYNGTIWQIITQDGANAVNAVTGTGTSGKIAVWSDNTQLTSLESFNINPNVAVLSNPTALDDDPIFEVKNKAGQLVFGVYQSGVRIYVDDTQTKAAKGGFAIGGLSNSTKIETPLYFSVSPDSVRVLLREPSTKAAKGGFAIGGLSNSTKGVSQDLFFINSDSTRIYINADTNSKAAKGGFAIGGLSNSTKGTTEFMRITPDSSRIYIDTNPAKAGKGGFAIGGLSNSTKIPREEYLRITRDSTRINVAENTTKAAKGGFAVGGLSTEKINPQNFMFLTPENYLIGHEARKSLKTGTYNSFIGYMAGQSSIGGNKNIFIGQEAGKSNKNGNENIFIGYAAGTNGYEGNWNTFLGLETGYSNTGSNNTFIGYKAGKSHTTNGGNVYIGSKAGENAINGEQNVFIGESSGQLTKWGKHNVFMGHQTGFNNYGTYPTSDNASFNVYMGYQAGYTGSNNQRNVFIGYKAGNKSQSGGVWWYGSLNVFLGNEAGLENISGGQNVAVGDEAFKGNTTGHWNIAIGKQALYGPNTGDNNVAFGKLSMEKNTSGSNNIAIGIYALSLNTIGNQNIAIGGGLGGNRTGDRNVGIGSGAGRAVSTTSGTVAIGARAIFNAGGTQNTAIGDSSLYNLQNGTNNTSIGSKTGVLYSSSTYNNSTAIGNQAIIRASNQVILGNSAISSIGGQVAWSTLSDKRIKEDTKENVPGIEFIKLLKPVTYKLNILEQNRLLGINTTADWKEISEINKMRFSGFLAQDVEEAARSIGYEFSGIDKSGSDNRGLYSLRYSDFTVPLVKAVQEQQVLIENQSNMIKELLERIERLEKMIESK